MTSRKPVAHIRELTLRRRKTWFTRDHEPWLESGPRTAEQFAAMQEAEAVWFHRVGGIHLHEHFVFPKARTLILANCDKNFVYYNCFPRDLYDRYGKLRTIVMYSHPCEPEVLKAWQQDFEKVTRVLAPRGRHRWLDTLIDTDGTKFYELQPRYADDAAREALGVDVNVLDRGILAPAMNSDIPDVNPDEDGLVFSSFTELKE